MQRFYFDLYLWNAYPIEFTDIIQYVSDKCRKSYSPVDLELYPSPNIGSNRRSNGADLIWHSTCSGSMEEGCIKATKELEEEKAL